MQNKEFLKYNAVGLIPGPTESVEDFTKRGAYCLHLKDNIGQMMAQELPFTAEEMHANEDILKAGCQKAKDLYDINPYWVPLFFSNYKLSFWQGGCAWIFQHTEHSPTSAFFQLRKQFQHAACYLGIYNRDELITHELSHVGRMQFEEPKFEEILAYRSANSGFRRFFGPIIRSSSESMLFMISLLFLLFADIFSLTSHEEDPYHFSFLMQLLVLGLITFGLVRLLIRQRQFHQCLKNLKDILGDSHIADAVIYRLTDSEIISFGKISSQQIQKIVQESVKKSPRWKIIYEAYFKGIYESL